MIEKNVQQSTAMISAYSLEADVQLLGNSENFLKTTLGVTWDCIAQSRVSAFYRVPAQASGVEDYP